MDQLTDLTRKVRWYLFSITGSLCIALLVMWWLGNYVLHLQDWQLGVGLVVFGLILSAVLALLASNYVLEPLRLLWLAIIHVSPEHQGTAPPNMQQARLGRELLTNLALQIYQLASHESANAQDLAEHRSQVIQAANARTSSKFTSGSNRMPPLPGPRATECWTR